MKRKLAASLVTLLVLIALFATAAFAANCQKKLDAEGNICGKVIYQYTAEYGAYSYSTHRVYGIGGSGYGPGSAYCTKSTRTNTYVNKCKSGHQTGSSYTGTETFHSLSH